MWWLVLLRGVLMVLFEIIALVSPGIALLTLVWVFGIYAILDGIAAAALGIRTRGEPHWVWTIVQGVVSVVASLVALVWPGVTALALLFLIAGRSCWGSRRSAVRSRPAGSGRMRGVGRWPPES